MIYIYENLDTDHISDARKFITKNISDTEIEEYIKLLIDKVKNLDEAKTITAKQKKVFQEHTSTPLQVPVPVPETEKKASEAQYDIIGNANIALTIEFAKANKENNIKHKLRVALDSARVNGTSMNTRQIQQLTTEVKHIEPSLDVTKLTSSDPKIQKAILYMSQEIEPVPEPKQAKSSLPNWYSAVDPASGNTYYYNITTGETTWTNPVGGKKHKKSHVKPRKRSRKRKSTKRKSKKMKKSKNYRKSKKMKKSRKIKKSKKSKY